MHHSKCVEIFAILSQWCVCGLYHSFSICFVTKDRARIFRKNTLRYTLTAIAFTTKNSIGTLMYKTLVHLEWADGSCSIPILIHFRTYQIHQRHCSAFVQQCVVNPLFWYPQATCSHSGVPAKELADVVLLRTLPRAINSHSCSVGVANLDNPPTTERSFLEFDNKKKVSAVLLLHSTA